MSETAVAGRVVLERVLPHTPEKVWRALTEGALLERWMWPNDFVPAVGRSFTFRAPPQPPHWDGIVRGEVLEVEAPQRLAFSWESGGVATVVVWTLRPAQGGVQVRMEQSGFGEDQEMNRRGAEFGWSRMIDGLAGVLQEIEP